MISDELGWGFFDNLTAEGRRQEPEDRMGRRKAWPQRRRGTEGETPTFKFQAPGEFPTSISNRMEGY